MISSSSSSAFTSARSPRSSTRNPSAPTRPTFRTRSSSLRAQWQTNQEAALAWRIKRAGIPEQWTLESFPFKRQPGVKQRQIRTFAELEFVPKAENIVFVPTGVGRTGLTSGLLLKALQNGHRGIFMRAQDLSDEMYASIADRSARRLSQPSGEGRRPRQWRFTLPPLRLARDHRLASPLLRSRIRDLTTR